MNESTRTCMICGFDGHSYDYYIWRSEGRQYPSVWICDVCYSDLQ